MGKRREKMGCEMAVTFRIVVFCAVLFFTSGWSVLPAFAGDERPCAEDISNFCKDVRPGGGRILSCLKEHEAELASDCRDKLGGVLKKIETAKRACTPDIEKYCKGVKEGEGRIIRCLEQRASELSPECAGQLEIVKTAVRGGGDREEK